MIEAVFFALCLAALLLVLAGFGAAALSYTTLGIFLILLGGLLAGFMLWVFSQMNTGI
jgi:hypothetical protein